VYRLTPFLPCTSFELRYNTLNEAHPWNFLTHYTQFHQSFIGIIVAKGLTIDVYRFYNGARPRWQCRISGGQNHAKRENGSRNAKPPIRRNQSSFELPNSIHVGGEVGLHNCRYIYSETKIPDHGFTKSATITLTTPK